jgi:GR25 family glycosyltransferase involved in LPS biosynthesis
MERELKHIRSSDGAELLSVTERHVAVDANAFSEDPPKDAEVDPFYTLADQLFVEPQPLVFPDRVELSAPIRMSRAEVAIARSHISVWRRIASANHPYALVLEDDTWFHSGFARDFDRAWADVSEVYGEQRRFDFLYVSYLEAKHGAPKALISNSLFRPERGIWHLSGYVLSREGAAKLLRLLPCRGPVDLWINHQFRALDVLATRKALISQRRDARSTNSYSILPALTKIGAITSEGAALFNRRPREQPVFAFGPEGSGHSSLAMALSMLGYRCCSDLETLPAPELQRLLEGRSGRVFDAYVNIGSLDAHIAEIKTRYPKAKFIRTSTGVSALGNPCAGLEDDCGSSDTAFLSSAEPNKWKVLCEHLRCAPPPCPFPALKDLGQRPLRHGARDTPPYLPCETPRRDQSPWVVEPRRWWHGIRADVGEHMRSAAGRLLRINDRLEHLDPTRWILRGDTFTDNLALFRPSNVQCTSSQGAVLFVRSETLGARQFSAASITSRDQYLYGRFEVDLQASDVPGVVTGFFLHRNSPRQEIDIEIAGNRPDRLILNVFYNPGGEGAPFDYGYRGAPSYVNLGFDLSEARHRFSIEWGPCEILWRVDDRLIHRRALWDPTPIPHLPMALHVNSWPSRSSQLAGRVKHRRLPARTLVRSIAVEAHVAISGWNDAAIQDSA